MFLKTTEEDILKIREEKYPLPSSFSVKNAILKTSGTDTLAEIYIELIDYLQKAKIFKNEISKNTLKFKVFEIVNQQMKDELINATDILKIQEVINKYGALQNDIFPCVDFIGDKKDASQHYIEDGNITLKYVTKFAFKEEDRKFLSIGLIFYFNLQDYLSEFGIAEKYVKKETLSSSLKIVDLLDSNGKNINMDCLQDLRTVNKIFKDNAILDSINSLINLQFKETKLLSQPQKFINNEQFFSNLYFSRDTLGNLNVLFSIDFNKIVENYSSFSKFIKNTHFPADLFDKCKISSLKIVKRQVVKNSFDDKNSKIFIKKTPVESVIASSQEKDNFVIKEINQDTASIKEIKLFDDLKCLEVIDKTVYKSKNNFYQYGIELNVTDGFYNYLVNLRDNLSSGVKVFKEYLNETNNYVKPLNKSNQKNVTIGYYDPAVESFTRRFSEEIFPQLYEKRALVSITNFVNTLKVFDLLENKNQLEIKPINRDIKFIKKNKLLANIKEKMVRKTQEEELVSSLISLISPTSATSNTILYFIKIYEKFISQIDLIIKHNKNNNFSLEYWFEKSLINTFDNPSYGYGYFDISKKEGMLRVTNLDLERKISLDINQYLKNNNLSAAREQYKYSSVAPSFINSKNKKINLFNIKNIENDDFIDLELDVKRYNSLDDGDKDFFIDDTLQKKPVETQKIRFKSERVANKHSFVTKNLFKNVNDDIKIKKFGAEVGEILNNDINPDILFLAMLKNTHKNKPVYNPIKKSIKNNLEGIFNIKKFASIPDEIPYHISSLMEKNDTFFSDMKIKYLTDIHENSKFLFLYNSIHQIEFLKINNNNVKQENWNLLTKKEYDAIPLNSRVLCKLKLYQNPAFFIDSFEEVSLPIYDQYFILEKNITKNLIDLNLSEYKKKFLFSALKLKNSIIFNTIAKNLKTMNIEKSLISNIKTSDAKMPIKINSTNKNIKNNIGLEISKQFSEKISINDLNPKLGKTLAAVLQPSINGLNLNTTEQHEIEIVSVMQKVKNENITNDSKKQTLANKEQNKISNILEQQVITIKQEDDNILKKELINSKNKTKSSKIIK